jgi:hypothetical protein
MNKAIFVFGILIIIVVLVYLVTELCNTKESVTPMITDQKTLGTASDMSFNNTDSALRYNTDNLDISYHEDPSTFDTNELLGNGYMFDNSGNKMVIPSSGTKTNTVYFNPGEYKYGPSSYIPKYEDSVFLSRTANIFYGNTASATASIKGGVCNYNKNNLDELENACQHVDPNVCASTSCCVLLGGTKCVSGSKTGPTMKSHYNNPVIPNLDYYYYQGKCYGNCSKT